MHARNGQKGGGKVSKQTRRAWDMLAKGDEPEAVRIATGLSKAVLDAMLKDIQHQRRVHGWDDEPEF
ncbi:hypothetical protein G1C94_1372 [Bifidobacterium sp. DSM 109963]|uniref:Uncharacterized protein n=1 Tax=Bifidobacterium panos TaxID=2675321 RepID=A0ABX1SY37_9BIFI|nr:hypothetical protein [Bifidobacterium sp. DSM 109963]